MFYQPKEHQIDQYAYQINDKEGPNLDDKVEEQNEEMHANCISARNKRN